MSVTVTPGTVVLFSDVVCGWARFPIPKRFLDSEIPVVGSLAPAFGWKPWQGDASTWPISVDMAIRHAFFTDSRPISLLHELVDIAGGCPSVDADQLRRDLDEGTARARMMRTYREHADDVQGSPHFFFADGSNVHNPGVELHWEGEPGAGFPVVDSDDASIYDRLVKHAAA